MIKYQYKIRRERGRNDEKNQKLYSEYEKIANGEKNVIFGGRLGMYRYFDMDKVIDEALKCAASL